VRDAGKETTSSVHRSLRSSVEESLTHGGPISSVVGENVHENVTLTSIFSEEKEREREAVFSCVFPSFVTGSNIGSTHLSIQGAEGRPSRALERNDPRIGRIS